MRKEIVEVKKRTIKMSNKQCDQIAKLFFNSRGIYRTVNLSSNMIFCQRKFKILPKYLINPHRIAQRLSNYAKVVKFRHFWSHWAR